MASGQTHFLNELAAWILRQVGETPESEDMISRRLAAAFGGEVSSELLEAVAATLRVLEHLGLLEVAEPI